MRPARCWALRTVKEIHVCLSNFRLLSTITPTPRCWTSDTVFKRWPLILYVGCKQLLIRLWLAIRKTRHFSLAILNCHWLDHSSKRSMATLKDRGWLVILASYLVITTNVQYSSSSCKVASWVLQITGSNTMILLF